MCEHVTQQLQSNYESIFDWTRHILYVTKTKNIPQYTTGITRLFTASNHSASTSELTEVNIPFIQSVRTASFIVMYSSLQRKHLTSQWSSVNTQLGVSYVAQQWQTGSGQKPVASSSGRRAACWGDLSER